MEINTINKTFNEAWNYLQEKHESLIAADRYWIDLTKKPKLNQKEWKFYIGTLINLLLVGQRNNWLTLHVDGKGFTVYLVLDYQKCLINKKGDNE